MPAEVQVATARLEDLILARFGAPVLGGQIRGSLVVVATGLALSVFQRNSAATA